MALLSQEIERLNVIVEQKNGISKQNINEVADLRIRINQVGQ